MTRLAAALAILLLGAACAAPDAAADQARSLAGRAFVAESAVKDGKSRILDPTTLTFDGDKLRIEGCNIMTADATVEGEHLRVRLNRQTDRGCSQRAMDQDAWLLALLGRGPTWRIDGDHLVLSADGQEVRFMDKRVGVRAQPLAGPTWRVESFRGPSGIGFVPADVAAYLRIAADGTFTGSTGCNTIRGRVRLTAGTLTASDVLTTLKACGGAADKVDSALRAVLRGAVPAQLTANRLNLGPAGGPTVTLVASS